MNLKTESLSFGELLSNMSIYKNSLCDLEFNQAETKSAVAIIVKKTKKQNIKARNQGQSFVHDQILFLQRKKSPKDRFSGQICYPGGRQEPNQTLLYTAIRQTFEETNILLTKQNLVGCIDRQVNFIISTKKELSEKEQTSNVVHQRKKTQKLMVVYTFVFFVQSEFIESQQIKLNNEEMETYQWIQAKELVNSRNVCFLDYTEKIQGLAKVYQGHDDIKNNKNPALSCVSRALSPAFDIKMNQKLYGITFYIMLIIITNLIKQIDSLINQAQSSHPQTYQLKQLLCNLNQIKTLSQAHVIFQVNKPITPQFRQFQTALIHNMFKMRPKL